MSWPIGFGRPELRYRADLSGVVFVNGVAVTDPQGWIDLTIPGLPRASASPQPISLRIRVAVDSNGRTFLYAEQAECGGRRYGSLHGLTVSEGAAWLPLLAPALHDEIARRISAGRSARTATRRMRAVSDPRAEPADASANRVTPLAGVDVTERPASSRSGARVRVATEGTSPRAIAIGSIATRETAADGRSRGE